jgi:UDP-N-acetylglucosamine transferase subunit ALG13
MTKAVNRPEPLSVNGRIIITMPMNHRSIEIIDNHQTKVAAVDADMTAATQSIEISHHSGREVRHDQEEKRHSEGESGGTGVIGDRFAVIGDRFEICPR